LRESDHVVLALPLTSATRHIIGVPELALMRPSATLVNVGRGGLVDEVALADAVGARRIAAAALDVVELEQAGAEPLASIAEVLVTPHIASATLRTQMQTARQAAETVLAALEGAGISRLLNPRVLTRKAVAASCPIQ
jgi:gluconate 2-dehydrogenase